MRLEYRFAIGSISKTLVAVVIHQLVEKGVLELQRTPGDYLDAAVLDGIPNAAVAPLRTLLEHTSGIPTWEFDAEWIRRGRGDRFDPERPFAKMDTLAYVRRRAPATNAPGARYAYSNTNHTILGLVIEAVTDNTFAAEVRRRILDPLRLTSFALESFETIPPGTMATPHHLATPFFRTTAGVSRHFAERGADLIDTSAADLSPEWAAGGYVAAMADLARYGHALVENAFGEGVGAALRAYREIDGTPESPFPRRPGLGLFEFLGPSGPVAGHFGGTLGYCAALMFPPVGVGTVVAVGLNLGRMHTAADAAAEHALWQSWLLEKVYPQLA